MRTPFRLITAAAVAGAALVSTLAVASPAFAEGLSAAPTVTAAVPAQAVLNGIMVLVLGSALFVGLVLLVIVRIAVRRAIRRAARRLF